MTQTARALMEELERLPEAEQEERAASYLKDLQRRKRAPADKAGEQQQEKPTLYAPFEMLLRADLDLPPDYSETYEEHLYGIKKHD